MTLGTAFTIARRVFLTLGPFTEDQYSLGNVKLNSSGKKVEVSIPVASPLTIIKEHVSMKTEER